MRTAEWANFWKADHEPRKEDAIDAIKEAINRAKEVAKAGESKIYTPEEIKSTLKSFGRTRQLGWTSWALPEMAALPQEGLAELGREMGEMNHTIGPLVQVLTNLMNLLLEKTGGHRTICTMASFYRLSTKAGSSGGVGVQWAGSPH